MLDWDGDERGRLATYTKHYYNDPDADVVPLWSILKDINEPPPNTDDEVHWHDNIMYMPLNEGDDEDPEEVEVETDEDIESIAECQEELEIQQDLFNEEIEENKLKRFMYT